MIEDVLCPFSKPIIGNWCRCPHAKVYERCSGKLVCMRAAELRSACMSLVDLLKTNARFVLGMSDNETELSHAQLMKIRCGGLLGMQRVLDPGNAKPPVVREIIAAVEMRYGDVENFPFNDIVKEIQAFSHRKRRSER